MERPSLAGLLDIFQRRAPEIAYVQRHGYRTLRCTYGQVAQTAFRFARFLQSRGIASGHHVLFWGPNSAEWVAAFFGCALSGVIVVPMDDAASPDFALRVAQQVGARLVLASQSHAASVNSIPCILLEDLSATTSRHSPTPFGPVVTDANRTLEIVFTSGTTSEPKGVVITHANILANLAPLEAEMQKYLQYERFVHPVRFLSLLPLSHVFGQFMGMFLPPLLGGTVVFQEALNPAEIISGIRREKVSVLAAVPRVLQSLKEKIERDLQEEGGLEDFQRSFASSQGRHFLFRWWIFRRVHRRFGWKFWAFVSGGATLDRTTEEFWGRLGYAAIQGYGLTETSSLISVNHPFRLGQGSIGKVLGGRQVKLAADGEILVRGGGLAAGYWTGAQLKDISGDDGWYRTGDIGALDAAGNLYFKGRKKDVIVTSAGLNIYPEDLEAALRRQPEVIDCVIIAQPRDGNAEPCAVIILREGTGAIETVVRRANSALADYQRMNSWFAWPEQDFPRTSTQKPRIAEIQQFALAKLRHQNSPARPSPLADLIRQATGRTVTNLHPESRLDSDLNLSSLDRVQLLSALEDRYQLDLSETSFAAVNTVADLENMLLGGIPPRARYHYPRWAQSWPATWIRWVVHYLLLRPAVFLLGWPRISGRENLANLCAPVLVVCNHIGDVDVGFVHTALPAHLRHKLATATGGEAMEILRTPPASRNLLARLYDRVQWTLGVALLNLFPLPREAGFRQSFAFAGESVDRGYSILVFPEGRHTTDGSIGPFRAGIGLLAKNLAIPVVPMQIKGLFELKQAGKKFAPPYAVEVKIGKPVSFPPDVTPEQIAKQLQQLVEKL